MKDVKYKDIVAHSKKYGKTYDESAKILALAKVTAPKAEKISTNKENLETPQT